MTDRSLPLEGIRIVDLTAFWAGPAATQLLGLLGADVIKVESVQRPDGMRFTGCHPPGEAGWWEWGYFYQAVNVSKRGITLDLTNSRGRELLLELLSRSDVLIENFTPRVLDHFGITWEEVRVVNPRAIMIRMPAFGLDGPWRDRTGFAQTMEQGTGMAWITGFADGPAVIPRGPCDPTAGMHAVFALFAVLEERDHSGRGHFIESTMVEAALNVAAEVVIEHSAYGVSLCRDGNRGPVASPQGLYACRGQENWLAIAVATNSQWQSLCAVLEMPDWCQREDLRDVGGRQAAHDEIDEHLRAWVAGQDRDMLCERLVGAGVPAAPAVESSQVVNNPQHRARGFIEAFDHELLGRHEIMGVPFRFASRTGNWLTRSAPRLGEHNDEVLGGILHIADEERERLCQEGVIGDAPSVG